MSEAIADGLDLFDDEPVSGTSHANVAPAVPAKFQGKTVEQLIEMNMHSEKMIGRQSAEVATLRRIQRLEQEPSRQETQQRVERKPVTVETLLSNPEEALHSAIDNSDLNRRTLAAEARAARVEAKFGERNFVTKYPTFKDDMEDPSFTAFIARNATRAGLADKAAHGDYDAASDLWDMWGEVKEVTAAPRSDRVKAVALPNTMRATAKDGQASSRKFSRAKIADLRDKAESGDIAAKQRWNDADFQRELGQAHVDGRVV